MELVLDLTKYKEFIIHLDDYNITLLKLSDEKFIPIPRFVKIRNAPKGLTADDFDNPMVNKYAFILPIKGKVKIETFNNYNFTRMIGYVRKLSIQTNLQNQLYKIFGVDYNGTFYVLYAVQLHEKFDEQIVELIKTKFMDLISEEKFTFVNKLNKIAANVNAIKDYIQKEPKRKIKVKEIEDNITETKETIEEEEFTMDIVEL